MCAGEEGDHSEPGGTGGGGGADGTDGDATSNGNDSGVTADGGDGGQEQAAQRGARAVGIQGQGPRADVAVADAPHRGCR